MNAVSKDKIPEKVAIYNDKLREQTYKETIKDFEPEFLLCIIKTTYLRKKKRLEQGKKTTAVDEHNLNLAENLFFSEICLALKKDKEEVHDLIVEAVNMANSL